MADPSHDWELIFESPEEGFIPLVRQAKTIAGLRECTHLIIRSLFNRDDDTPIRESYEQALDGMLPKAGAESPPMDKGVSQIVQLLREIKEHRQIKAAEHAEHILEQAASENQNPEPERRESTEPNPLPGLEVSESSDTQVADDEEQIIGNAFADLFSDRIKKRLDVLNQRIGGQPGNSSPPPFILSKDFAAYFDTLLRDTFIPAFLDESRALISRTAQQPLEARHSYLADQFDGRVSSQNLWDRWKDVWSSLIHIKELPEKPEPEKKSGLLDGLKKKKKKKTPSWMKEMTLDEWKVRTREIKTANKKAKELWASIAVESNSYQAPEDRDEKLLMDLFARSPGGMQNNINALRQIAQQGGEAGRSLSAYAQGKDIDLPLLAVCFQSPDLFLGKQQFLSKMLMGKDDRELSGRYPLVKRYLAAHIK